MPSHPSKEYKALMNHIHNELGITKDDIRQWTEAAIERVAERKIDVLLTQRFGEYSVKTLIDDTIRDKGNMWWGESEDSFDTYIKKEVVKTLLQGVKLKVEVTKTKKEATPTHTTVILHHTKRKSA